MTSTPIYDAARIATDMAIAEAQRFLAIPIEQLDPEQAMKEYVEIIRAFDDATRGWMQIRLHAETSGSKLWRKSKIVRLFT